MARMMMWAVCKLLAPKRRKARKPVRSRTPGQKQIRKGRRAALFAPMTLGTESGMVTGFNYRGVVNDRNRQPIIGKNRRDDFCKALHDFRRARERLWACYAWPGVPRGRAPRFRH